MSHRPLQTLAVVILLAVASAALSTGTRGQTDRGEAGAAGRAADPADAAPGGEWVAEYVEYRFLPALGQITVADGVVRGERPVRQLRKNARDLAAQGVFPCTDAGRARTFRRTDEMGGRTFLTVITLIPPTDDDGEWTRRATVHVDGRKKVDCSIGGSPDGAVFVYGVIVFPEDGSVQVAASGADGVELYPPAELEALDHPGVITDDTLQPMEDEPDDAAPRIERA